MNTRTFAGVVIAVLRLGACSSASTTEPTTTTTLRFDASSDSDSFLNASSIARYLTQRRQAHGITPDQANCMANNIVNEFDTAKRLQIALDSQAGKPHNPDVEERGEKAILACLPAKVVAALANPNS